MLFSCERSRTGPKLCFGVLLFVFIYSLLLPSVLSNGYSGLRQFHSLRIPDEELGKEASFVGALKTRRQLADATTDNTSLILAAKRTHRKDILDNLNYYNGGWNISNQHYWSSAGTTALVFFVIAAIWFVLFGLTLSFICLCYCCCPREPYGYSRVAYALSLIFLILFTIAAIAGCIVLYTGQGKFHGSTTDTLNYVVRQADVTSKNLKIVSDYLASAKNMSVDNISLPQGIQKNIESVDSKINSSAAVLSTETHSNAEKIQNGLDKMRLALIILAAVMLCLAFIGFLCSILGLQCIVYTLVIVGWILVTGTFILCGVFLLLHNVLADTCVSMDEWVQNPTAHTALDDIISCVDNATAQETLQQTKNVTFQLVFIVNNIITNVSNANVPPIIGPPIYINQSGPLVPKLCTPYNSDLTDRKCASGEVTFTNAPQVWKNYICQAKSGICYTTGRLTPDIYNQMVNAVNVSYGLNHYGPFLIGLVDCSFVRETFTSISKNNCPGLRRYTQWIYIGLVLVSGAVMLSLIFWVIYARERRHRVYTKNYDATHPQGRYKPG